MARIISIANQKGGVGKTTTNINLAAALAQKGKKVLIIDSDPQGNTTSGYGINKDEMEYTFYDLLCNECSFEQAKIKSEYFDTLDILGSNIELSGAEIELADAPKREYILKGITDKIKDKYDYVLIDCPPSLNLLTLNALTASDSVLVPLQCEYYALEGLTQLMHTISIVQKKLNKTLEIEGILFTMFDARTNLSVQVVEEVKEHLDGRASIYATMIPRNVRLSEAPSHGLPINLYDNKSKGAAAYDELAEEIIQRGE